MQYQFFSFVDSALKALSALLLVSPGSASGKWWRNQVPLLRKPSVGFIAVCAGYAMAMFHRTAFSEIAPLLGAEIGLSAARLGWIGSSFFWVYLLTQIPAGLLLDAVGPRRMSAWACAAMACGAAGFALASTAVTLAAARGLWAAGAVAIFLSLIAYCRESDPDHANAALGRGLMIGNLGGIVSAAPLGFALEVFGWRDVWWLMAAVAAVSSLILLLTIPGRGRPEAPAQSLRRALPSFLRSMHRTDVYLGAGALAGLAGAFHGFTGFGSHQLAASLGIDVQAQGIAVSVMIGGFAFGVWLWGRLGDKTAVRDRIVVQAPLAAAVLWTVLLVTPPMWTPWLCALLFAAGLACAAFGCVYGMLAELSGPAARNSVTAAANCGIALAAASCQVVQGLLPGSMAALPCLGLSVLGLWCCRRLAQRCQFQLRETDTPRS